MVAPNLIENPTSGSILIQSGGVDVASRPILNFIGATVVDDPGNNRVNITIAGGGGTLDAAYDFGGPGAGRTIIVDSGAVQLTGAGTVVGGLTVNGSRAIASAVSAVWDEVLIDADVSLSGVTNVTTATGFNMVTLNAPTITDAGTITSVTNAATLYIGGPPVGSGLTVTNAYAIWVDAGNIRCDGLFLASASSPAYAWELDQDTGFRNAAANEISFVNGGLETLRVAGALPSNNANYIFTQAASGSGARHGLRYTASANTNQAAGVEIIDVDWNLTATLQHATGALATQRSFVVQPRTYSFVAASTITTAATVAVVGSPTAGTNATITTSLAFWVAAGGGGSFNTYFGATPSMGSGVGVIGIANAGTNPTVNPVGGGILYSNGGAGTWLGSGGTTTAFGPAGPHCGDCGMDMWTVAAINAKWKAWCYECGYCGSVYKGGPQNVFDQLDLSSGMNSFSTKWAGTRSPRRWEWPRKKTPEIQNVFLRDFGRPRML